MNVRHTLQVTLQSDETVRVGRNHLQLIVRNNSAVMSFEQIVIRLSAPLGVTLQPSKVEFAPLQANSRDAVPVSLTTKRPGRYLIKIQANAFPKPKEGFLNTTQQIEICPELDITPNPAINSIIEEISHSSANHNQSPKTTQQSDDEGDIYSRYLMGLNRLKDRIEHSHPQFSDFLLYQQRLEENISATQRFGDTENRRAERSEVIEQLNKLTLSVLSITFNELCELRTEHSDPVSERKGMKKTEAMLLKECMQEVLSTEEEIRNLCFFHFKDVHRNLKSTDIWDAIALRLIAYCQSRSLEDTLWDLMRQQNPKITAKYEQMKE